MGVVVVGVVVVGVVVVVALVRDLVKAAFAAVVGCELMIAKAAVFLLQF